MKAKNDLVYLNHIHDAIIWIDKYIEGKNKRAFINDHLIQDAVIRQIEIIGEATKNLSKNVRSKYPDIPWKDMAGMRDKLIHNYMGVDIDSVWETVKNDIPQLKSSIGIILQKDT